MSNKYEVIYELWQEQSLQISSSPTHWMTFLKTASFIYKYRFEDQILIYAQKPNATACAEYDVWNTKMHRWIKRGAKGIALLRENSNSLRYVFDISDTRSPNNQMLRLWGIDENDYQEIIEMITDRYNISKPLHDFGETLLEIANIITEDNYQDYLNSLIKYHENSLLDDLEESEIRDVFKTLISNSVAFELMNRCGIDTNFYLNEEDFKYIYYFNSYETIGQLGISCHDISEVAFKDISEKAREIMIRTFEKNKVISQNKDEENERSVSNERIDIQANRRFPNTKHQSRTTNSQQSLRTIKIELPKEQSSGVSVLFQGEQQIKRTFENDREAITREKGNTDATVISEVSSTEQSTESNEMGATYEQPETNSRRNYTKGDNLQLNLELGGNDENQLPPFNLIDLPTILREDIQLKKSKEEIIQFFKDHTDEQERANFLESCYDNTLVETFRDPLRHDYTHIGYKKDEHGLNIWCGSWQKPQNKSHFSFLYLQEQITHLIENNEYLKSADEKLTAVQWAAQSYIFNNNVLRVVFTRHQFLNATSSEIISYFNSHDNIEEQIEYLSSIYSNDPVDFLYDDVQLGYQKVDNGLSLYFGTQDERVNETFYSWKLVAYDTHGLIISRYFDPTIQIPTMEEQTDAVYKSIKEYNDGKYFSKEEINRCLQSGSVTESGKYRIYEQMLKHESVKENADFLKKEYGWGGSSSAFIGAFISIDSSPRGITLRKNKWIGEIDVEITLKWKDVAKRIAHLVLSDQYLTKDEKQYYPLYLEKQKQKQLEYEQVQRNREKGIYTQLSESVQEHDNTPKDYDLKLGNTVYIGIDAYEIIESGNTITLSNKEFPLFQESFSLEQLKARLKENPLNEHLLVPIESNPQEKTLRTEKDLYTTYLPVLVERIKESPIYEILRDQETSIEEAEDLVRSEMITLIGSMNEKHRELYLAYTGNDKFKELMIDDILDRTYQDISKGHDNSSQLSTDIDNDVELYSLLYKEFDKFAHHITDNRSCLLILKASEYDNPLMITNHDDEPDKITISHYYQTNGIEISDPIMEFTINRENKLIYPIYYRHNSPYLELSLEYNESILNDEDVKNELSHYSKTWFSNIITKNYQLSSEQIYSDRNHSKVYDVDIYDNNMVYVTNMPFDELSIYCKEMGFTISEHLKIQDEITTAEKIASKLKMEDVYITWDDDNNEIIAHDDMDNVWHGKDFYDFMLNEAIVYEDDQTSSVIPTPLLRHFEDLSHSHEEINTEKIPIDEINEKHNY